MQIRRKKHRSVPGLNMASMPDLIFTVLFFFMIVTHMRNETVKVKLQVPQGTEVTKSSNKFSTINIYIGRNDYGDTQIQVNDRMYSLEQSGHWFGISRLIFLRKVRRILLSTFVQIVILIWA